MNNEVVAKLSDRAVTLSRELADDFCTVRDYSRRGNGDMAMMALRTATETALQIQGVIDSLQNAMGIRLGQIINIKA